MEYILTTENLTKAYGTHKAADQINIHIKKLLNIICWLMNQPMGLDRDL